LLIAFRDEASRPVESVEVLKLQVKAHPAFNGAVESVESEQGGRAELNWLAARGVDQWTPGSAVRRHTGVVAALMLQVSAAGVVGSGPVGSEV
jgi:hypothetical protein